MIFPTVPLGLPGFSLRAWQKSDALGQTTGDDRVIWAAYREPGPG